MREEAKRFAELYQALADGKTLQVKEIVNGGTERWSDIESYGVGLFLIKNREKEFVRIKPEPKKVKVSIALHKDETFGIYRYELVKSDTVADHARVEQSSSFVEWLDHLEYELPEGEV